MISRMGDLSRALALVVVIVSSACQDAVVDLATVNDEDLDRPEAIEALVAGMGRTLSGAVGLISQTGMIAARELEWGGLGEEFGATLAQAAGELNAVDSDRHWKASQQARWTAEDGVRRMREILGDEEFARSSFAAEALLYVGFSNRLLGESMCQGVVDGGPALPRTAHFQRGVDAFTEALAIAGAAGAADLAIAARAGRASALVGLGDWSGARADASGIPEGFAYAARFDDTQLDFYNRIYWGSTEANRAHTTWATFYDGYYEETADPRVPWIIHPGAPLTTRNNLPFHAQAKFTRRNDPIELVSWEEMRLIIAEAGLRSGDVEGARIEIDALREAAGVAPWPIDDAETAWTALKRERGIELWLEGRRLWDLDRWIRDGVPGVTEDMSGRDTCFPIGATEQGTNPNLP